MDSHMVAAADQAYEDYKLGWADNNHANRLVRATHHLKRLLGITWDEAKALLLDAIRRWA
jgi:hypothetical protein